ncbi:hypothetical protein, partial [Serratia fonticola]
MMNDIKLLKESNEKMSSLNNGKYSIDDLNKTAIKNRADLDSISFSANSSFYLITLLAALFSGSVVFLTYTYRVERKEIKNKIIELTTDYINKNNKLIIDTVTSILEKDDCEIINNSSDNWFERNKETITNIIILKVDRLSNENAINESDIDNEVDTNNKSVNSINDGFDIDVNNNVNDELAVNDNVNTRARSYKKESEGDSELKTAIKLLNAAYNSAGEAKQAGYDALIARFEGSDNNAILLRVAMAMFNKAFNATGEAKQAGYDALIARFEGSDDNAILLQVAKAMYSKAYNAASEAAKQTGYDALIARFEGSDDNKILLRVAMAMFNKAYNATGEAKQAGYDALIARFEGSDDNAILLQVAKAMYSKAYNAASEAAKQTGYDALIARFEGSDDNKILLRVAMAMFNKAYNATGEAKQTGYDALIARFEGSDDNAILLQVAKAMYSKA